MQAANSKIKVLFLCTGNSCRSQMAEGWARHYAGDRIESHSAGVAPAGVHPLAIEVMSEVGVDISSQQSKDVDALDGLEPDIVITLCDYAASQCPDFPGAARKEHWPTYDPSQTFGTRDELLPKFRKTRDELGDRIRAFLEQVLGAERHRRASLGDASRKI